MSCGFTIGKLSSLGNAFISSSHQLACSFALEQCLACWNMKLFSCVINTTFQTSNLKYHC